MSSILRALKKLDEEALYGEGHTGEQKIKMKRMINRRTGTPMVIKRILFIVSVVLPVGTAVLVIMTANPKRIVSPKEPAAHSPQIPGRSLAQSVNPLPTKKKQSPGEAAPPAMSPGGSQPAAEPINPERERPSRSANTIERLQPDTGKNITEKPAIQKNVGKNNNTGFILNGIIWSDNPAMRVALINGQYLKEGDSIDGAAVVEIKQKTVTLKRGEKKWTITIEK